MQITLYNCTAADIEVDKTGKLTLIGTIEGTPDPGLSLDSPTFSFQSSTIPTFNYIYVADYASYYYVKTAPVWLSKDVWMITCVKDRLYTYKTGILNLAAFVSRNQNNYDNTISDAYVKTACGRTISKMTRTSPSGWITTSTYPGTGKNLIVGISATFYSKNLDSTLYWREPVVYFRMTYDQYRTMVQTIKLAGQSVFGHFAGYDKIEDIIVSVVWSPYADSLDNSQHLEHFDQAWIGWDMTDGVPFTIDADRISVTYPYISRSWTFARTPASAAYLDFAPFRKYACEFHPIGRMQIDDAQVATKSTVKITATINPISGNALIYVNDDTLIGETSFNFALEQIKASGEKDVTTLAGAISSSVQVAAVFHGGPVALSGAALNAYSSTLRELDPVVYSVAGSIAYQHISEPEMYEEITPHIDTSANMYGRPYMGYVSQLSLLSGFTVCDRVRVDGLICSQDDRDAIERALLSGVILPVSAP